MDGHSWSYLTSSRNLVHWFSNLLASFLLNDRRCWNNLKQTRVWLNNLHYPCNFIPISEFKHFLPNLQRFIVVKLNQRRNWLENWFVNRNSRILIYRKICYIKKLYYFGFPIFFTNIAYSLSFKKFTGFLMLSLIKFGIVLYYQFYLFL